MERRYQVFVSSTFRDLIEERKEVIQALLEMDCIPAGMEMFPSADSDQWTLIQKVIDQSDFYVLVIGGRYGSTTAEGVSYTEMEYDYAVAQGKPVLGFVHAQPGSIPQDKVELEADARARLDAFQQKVQTRHVKMYNGAEDLGSKVSRALNIAMRNTTAEGWVPGRFAMTPETQTEMAELRAQVVELKQEIAAAVIAKDTIPPGLASGDDKYDLHADLLYYTKATMRTNLWTGSPKSTKRVVVSVSWNEIVYDVGAQLINEATEEEIASALDQLALSVLVERQKSNLPQDMGQIRSMDTLNECFSDVVVQLFALGIITHGIIKRSTTNRSKYWALTPLGQDTLMKLRAISKGVD